MAPLARKPKQLDRNPTVFELAPGGAGGLVLRATGARRPGAGAPESPPGAAEADSAEEGSILEEVDLSAEVDPVALAQARHIAARLSLRRPPHDVRPRRGSGELGRMGFSDNADDLDLEATLERLGGKPVPEDDDIVVRDRLRTKRSVVLAIDVSGSMRGERIRAIAATVGALALELAHDDLAVVAFWSDAAVLTALGRVADPDRLLHTVLRIPARGLTNVGLPLEVAARQLARVSARDARVLLLSDCVHNAGPDPRMIATRLPRLDVLLETAGEHDLSLGRDLARAGRGRLAPIRTYRDVPAALVDIFAR
ncbi:VWA domain-containing protein [Jatrophihabitans sp.]|uniref:VWA domain-containing protein n=1 Tax=Jatrophihabitans sp. TaxID=1932789 RepID=UPI0030C6F68D|nr:putative von Willebrand factor type containing CoxE-like [Jatrophihabitans sp.]